jgi:cell division septation protein DedD
MKFLCILSFCTCFANLFSQNSIDANIPDKLAAYSIHTVEIIIKKGPISSFSKYQLDVPPNVIVKEGISKDGNFSFENRRAKLVWVDSPKGDDFTVTMILAVGNATGQAMFEHRYYYIDGDTKKEIADGPMYVEFTPGTPSKEYNDVLEAKTTTPVVSTPTVAKVVSQPTIAPVKTEDPNKINTTIPVTPNSNTTIPTTTVSTSQPNSSNTTPVSLPEIKEYRVQIASMATKPNLSKYTNLGKITVIEENGMYKVLAGGFKTKEEAVKKMEELKTQGYNGFVACFVNGVKVK